MKNESSFGRLCGPEPPQGHRTTTSNYTVIHFVSDSSSNGAGFMAVVTATLGDLRTFKNAWKHIVLGPERGCGGKLSAKNDSSQKLVVPFNERGVYFNNMRCLWKISTQTNQIIEIKLTNFQFEKRYRANNMSECYDFMAVNHPALK